MSHSTNWPLSEAPLLPSYKLGMYQDWLVSHCCPERFESLAPYHADDETTDYPLTKTGAPAVVFFRAYAGPEEFKQCSFSPYPRGTYKGKAYRVLLPFEVLVTENMRILLIHGSKPKDRQILYLFTTTDKSYDWALSELFSIQEVSIDDFGTALARTDLNVAITSHVSTKRGTWDTVDTASRVHGTLLLKEWKYGPKTCPRGDLGTEIWEVSFIFDDPMENKKVAITYGRIGDWDPGPTDSDIRGDVQKYIKRSRKYQGRSPGVFLTKCTATQPLHLISTPLERAEEVNLARGRDVVDFADIAFLSLSALAGLPSNQSEFEHEEAWWTIGSFNIMADYDAQSNKRRDDLEHTDLNMWLEIFKDYGMHPDAPEGIEKPLTRRIPFSLQADLVIKSRKEKWVPCNLDISPDGMSLVIEQRRLRASLLECIQRIMSGQESRIGAALVPSTDIDMEQLYSQGTATNLEGEEQHGRGYFFYLLGRVRMLKRCKSVPEIMRDKRVWNEILELAKPDVSPRRRVTFRQYVSNFLHPSQWRELGISSMEAFYLLKWISVLLPVSLDR